MGRGVHDVMRKARFAVLCALALVAVVNLAVLLGGRHGRVEEPECVLVLGAGVEPNGTPSSVLHDRLEEALALHRSGRAGRILVSGGPRSGRYDEPNTMRAWLEARGVPPDRITMDHAGADTYSSMWRARNVFGVSRVVVVTQRFHLPRALWLARSLGMEAEGAAADRRVYRDAFWFEVREAISRTKAFADVVVRRRPALEGVAARGTRARAA